jgi:hypothetical protein
VGGARRVGEMGVPPGEPNPHKPCVGAGGLLKITHKGASPGGYLKVGILSCESQCWEGSVGI